MMDTLNYPGRLNKAYTANIPCDFCAQQFDTIAEKNVHIFEHFEQQICQWCDQNLLRIGDSFYILHATVTCISRTEINQEESELYGQNDNELCLQQEHLIDGQSQVEDDCVDKQEINGTFNQRETAGLSSTTVCIDASSFKHPGGKINNPNDEFSPQELANETHVKRELDEDFVNMMPSVEEQVVAFDMPLPNKAVTKCSKSQNSVQKQAIARSKCREIRSHTISRDIQVKYSCNKCGSSNLTKMSYMRHHKNPNFRCHECGLKFCQFGHLKNHYTHLHTDADPYDGIDLTYKLSVKQVRARRNVKNLQCTVDGCNELVSSISRHSHMTKKHKLCSSLACAVCKKVFSTIRKIRQHMISHDEHEKDSCSKCGSSNLTEESYKRHHLYPNFKCHECGVAFCKFEQLKDHYKQMHADADPCDGIAVASKLSIEQVRARRKIKKFQCPIPGCNELVSTESRHNHMAWKHNLLKYSCDICHRKFPALHNIRRHMNGHSAQLELHRCDLCGISNISKASLLRHHNKKTVECSWCRRRFCMRKDLKQHNITDHMAMKDQNADQFQCDICMKCFATKTTIETHILRLHVPVSEMKSFKCNLCGNAHLTQSRLDRHIKRSHMQQPNFICSECGKTFCHQNKLVTHMTQHTGEKKFECTFDGCLRKFRTSTGRTEHMRSHTGVKPYGCPVTECDRRFSYAVDFRRHKFNAHGIYTKKFPCHICADIFPENMLLKKHMKKHGVQV